MAKNNLHLISVNCNGVRSAIQKGLVEYLQKQKADIVCLQETKAQEEQIPAELWEKTNYSAFFHSAEKKGYSGVGILSQKKPKEVITGLGIPEFDREGRSLLAVFDNYAVWNVYFPSGTTGDIRQEVKMRFLDDIHKIASSHKKKYKNLILCGDVNIAHTEMDIHDPVRNKKNSGFLPEEREWLSQFLKSGFVDTFRLQNPNKQEYSWWTFRANARAKNKGWRIDYFFVSDSLQSGIKEAGIDPSVVVSDHTPIYLKLSV